MTPTADLTPAYDDPEAWRRVQHEAGAYLLRWVGTIGWCGHASPASTLQYLPRPTVADDETWPETLGRCLVQDMIAWTAGHEDAEQRIRNVFMPAAIGIISETMAPEPAQ